MSNAVKDIVYSIGYGIFSLAMLAPLAHFSKWYPPNEAPDGMEGIQIGIIVSFLTISCWSLLVKRFRTSKWEPYRNIPLVPVFTVIFYVISAIVATYQNGPNISAASLGIVLVQAVLLGTILEVDERPIQNLDSKSTEEKQFYIENWRQMSQIVLTGAVAIGIGFFLQSYSQFYMNAKHLLAIFAPLVFGVGICLFLIRERIKKVGRSLAD